MNWYPIKLTAHVRTYAFGERLIPEKLGKENVPDGVVAETWEISDYRDTTGRVLNGPLTGQTLHQVTERFPDEVVGEGWRGPHFPLLEKFLDASYRLPVHLHADEKRAREFYMEPNGKTEAWHIIWAAPGASILAGLKGSFSRQELFDAFLAQDYDAVMPRFPIQAGDTVYVPAGVIHSFGPDTLIFEIQQTSDLGSSVMPADLYGKALDRETWERNIDTTLDELRTHYSPRPNPGLAIERGKNRYVYGAAGPFFALERWTLREPRNEPAHPHRCLTISNVGDPVRLHWSNGQDTLARAESCILPAAIGEVQIAPMGEGSLIAGYVPDLQQDVIEPLRSGGYTDEQIRTLGEVGI